MKRLLVVSAFAHIAIFAMLMRSRPVAPAPAPVAIESHDEITIEMESVTAPVPTSAAAESVAIAAVVPRGVQAAPIESAPIPSGIDAPPDTAPYASNGTIIVFAPNVGIGGKNPFLINGVDAGGGNGRTPGGVARVGEIAGGDPMYVPLEKRAEQSIKDALRAKDQNIGLGLEGPVVHALEDATHAGFAPDRGNATFVAVIDERGLVIDLKILSSNASTANGARGWEEVRQRAVKSLATAKIDMRGVKRAELKIAVESEVLLPSGSKPEDSPLKPTGTPVKNGIKVETAAPGSPSGADVAAGVEVLKFDVADIGAKKQRVVHAKLVLMTTR